MYATYPCAHVDLAGPLETRSIKATFIYLMLPHLRIIIIRVKKFCLYKSQVALAGGWPPEMFLSREALEEASPSRQHGIDVRLEASYRWSYCEFLKDSGIELKMCGSSPRHHTHLRTANQAHDTFQYSTSLRPQLTIATASVFCHRFFASHSHGAPANDRYVREA